MKPFVDSTPLLGYAEALQQRFQQDGYLFLKTVADPGALWGLREKITAILARYSWLRSDAKPIDAVPGTIAVVEGEEAYLEVYDQIQKLEEFHRIPHQAGIQAVFKSLLGDSAFPHPLSIARLVFPDNDAWSTPPHQDYPNNQGTKELYACWLPLSECRCQHGSLSVLEGSHHFGVLPLEFALGAGHRQAVLDERLNALAWVGGDFQLGDMLIFHSLTLHRSLHNSTDRMRLSVDYRFQREYEPLTESCLQPHFNRLSWEEIYAGWSNRDIAYYWQKKQYTLAAWDDSYHKLSDEQEEASIKQRLKYDRQRKH